MTQTETLELLERKVLRHLAIKAGRNPAYFVSPAIDGLMRATWCDDEQLLSDIVAGLVRNGKIIPASRTIDGQVVYGFTCLPAKLREQRYGKISSELKLTPYDRELLKRCGIAVDEEIARTTANSDGAGTAPDRANDRRKCPIFARANLLKGGRFWPEK